MTYSPAQDGAYDYEYTIPSAVLAPLGAGEQERIKELYSDLLNPLVRFGRRQFNWGLFSGLFGCALLGTAQVKWKNLHRTLFADVASAELTQLLLLVALALAIGAVCWYIGHLLSGVGIKDDMKETWEDLLEAIEECGDDELLLRHILEKDTRLDFKALLKKANREVIERLVQENE